MSTAISRYVSGNETYRTWFGRDPDSLKGVAVVDVLGQETMLRLRPYMNRALLGEAQRFEEVLSGINGTTRLVELNYTPDQPDETGTVPGFVVLAGDISERKRLEDSLRAGEERWRRLFEGMAEGFFLGELILDPDHGRAVDFRFLEINPAFETLTGFPSVATVGKSARGIFPDLEEELIRAYARVVETGRSELFETRLGSLNHRWFEVKARPVEGLCFSGDLQRRDRPKSGFGGTPRSGAEAIRPPRPGRPTPKPEDDRGDHPNGDGDPRDDPRRGPGRLRAFESDKDLLVIENDWHESRVGSLVGPIASATTANLAITSETMKRSPSTTPRPIPSPSTWSTAGKLSRSGP